MENQKRQSTEQTLRLREDFLFYGRLLADVIGERPDAPDAVDQEKRSHGDAFGRRTRQIDSAGKRSSSDARSEFESDS